MHESSLVRALLDRVGESIAHELPARVREIHVELGPLSGVEAELVQSAFEQIAPQSGLGEANLIILRTSLEALCLNCRTMVEIQSFIFRCMHCGSSRLQITRGDEFRLLSIVIEQSEQIGSYEH